VTKVWPSKDFLQPLCQIFLCTTKIFMMHLFIKYTKFTSIIWFFSFLNTWVHNFTILINRQLNYKKLHRFTAWKLISQFGLAFWFSQPRNWFAKLTPFEGVFALRWTPFCFFILSDDLTSFLGVLFFGVFAFEGVLGFFEVT